MGLLPRADGTSQFYSSTPKIQQLCNSERGTHACRFWLIREGWVFNFVACDEGSIDRIDFESDGLTMKAVRIEE
jgi:hypothetical protein